MAARVLRSPPGAAGRLQPGDWLIAGAIAWLAPLPLGLVAMLAGYAAVGLETALGTASITASGLLFALAYGLFVSPMLGLPVLAAVALLLWSLIRLGWGGPATMLAGGALAGVAALWLVRGAPDITGPALGVLYAALVRVGLNRVRPEIFTTC